MTVAWKMNQQEALSKDKDNMYKPEVVKSQHP